MFTDAMGGPEEVKARSHRDECRLLGPGKGEERDRPPNLQKEDSPSGHLDLRLGDPLQTSDL